MPKGTKIVDWTPENEAKLFHTIMAVHDIKVDNAKVAEAFGPDVPASCIVTKMSALRKKAAAMGIIPSPTPTTTTGRTTTAGKGKGKKTEGDTPMTGVDDQDTKEDDGLAQGETPPETSDEKVKTTPVKDKVIGGKVKKPRAPRKTPIKKAAKKISDPFVEEDDAKDDKGGILSANEDNSMGDANAQIAVETEGVKHEEA